MKSCTLVPISATASAHNPGTQPNKSGKIPFIALLTNLPRCTESLRPPPKFTFPSIRKKIIMEPTPRFKKPEKCFTSGYSSLFNTLGRAICSRMQLPVAGRLPVRCSRHFGCARAKATRRPTFDCHLTSSWRGSCDASEFDPRSTSCLCTYFRNSCAGGFLKSECFSLWC